MRSRVAGHERLILAIGGLLVFYVGTRLAVLWRFPPYFDEAFYAHEVPIALNQPAQRFISLNDSKGPLLIWLSFIPMKLGFAPLTSVRLVAQVSGLWTMGMTGLLLRRLADPLTALAGMALFALLPLWLVFTAIGFDEPLVAAAAMTALYLQVRLAQQPTSRDGLLLGLALAVGLLTKQSGEFAVILIPVSLLLLSWRAPDRVRVAARWLGCVILALLIAYGLYSVERLSPLYYERAAIAKSLHQYTPLSTALHDIGAIFQRNWPGYRAELDDYLTVPLVLTFAVGAGLLLARQTRTGLVILAWIVIPLAGVVLIAARPLGHYLVPAVTPALVPIALGLVETCRAVSSRLSHGRSIVALGALVVVALAPALWFDIHFVADPARTELPAYDDRELVTDAAAGSGWQQIVDIIERGSVGQPRPHTIAYAGLITYDVSLLLGDPSDVRYPYVPIDSPAAPQAQFVVDTDGLPPRCSAALPPTSNITAAPCTLIPASRLRLLSLYQRPRGGSTITLYQVLPAR
jgi:4-amino-4-deoxy-L-arabinose transferase-like glycosyltransferase